MDFQKAFDIVDNHKFLENKNIIESEDIKINGLLLISMTENSLEK